MRHTPFLDDLGITINDTVSDWAANVIDSSLAVISASIDWGEHNGQKRKPCPEQPILLSGAPIGMYHCPVCVDMQLASMPHLPPEDDYEAMTGHDWPAGYHDPEPEQDDRGEAA